MQPNSPNEILDTWLSLTNIQSKINNEIEAVLQEKHSLSLKEFYVLYVLSQTEQKKMRLQQLQELVGLSQSALSRLVVRMEAKSCGALQKHICQDDRRGIYTSMTNYGEEKLQGALNTFNECLQTALMEEKQKGEWQSLNLKLESIQQKK